MNQNKSTIPVTISPSSTPDFPDSAFKEAHGEIPYGMTNDYMFRAVLQSNNTVLKGLICSLLHLPEAEVLSVEITNPIILGQSFKNKEAKALNPLPVPFLRQSEPRAGLYEDYACHPYWISGLHTVQ